MYIIALTGPHDTGKTTTLNLLYKALCIEGLQILEGRERTNEWASDDFVCMFEYKGKKVVLYSMGDNIKEICNAIDKYKDKCYAFVCALSTNQRIELTIRKTYTNQEGFTYITIPKTLNGGPKLIADYYDMRRLIQRLDCVIENK